MGKGIGQIFDINAYQAIAAEYKDSFGMPEWLMVGLAILVILLIFAIIALLIFFWIRRNIKIRRKAVNQEELTEEIAALNDRVSSLVKEKEEILAMKVSQLGLKPGEPNKNEIKSGDKDSKGDDAVDTNTAIRFLKLHEVDEEFKNYKIKNYDNHFTLPEFCENFRNFAASQLKLYYSSNMMKLFVAAMASTKLVILQGISGTGKTSLAYAWGKFLRHDSCVASVQPSWRDRTELFGYFNEFTKKFNESEILKEMYVAGYTDDIFTIILDEMNISRVEYYFAEMLSILEMPNEDEWIVELVPNKWKNDPKKLDSGKLRIPSNMWYIGTINNDDSTFMVTDKVYDRAMPIDINDKGQPFDPIETDSTDVNYSYLHNLFSEAMTDNPMSQENLDKIEQMDNYVIQHFRIAFRKPYCYAYEEVCAGIRRLRRRRNRRCRLLHGKESTKKI